jgi:hypothetical protein
VSLNHQQKGVAMSENCGLLAIARAEALFASVMTTGTDPSPSEVGAAIRHAVRMQRGVRGCAAELATAYGDYPETAAIRMRWARRVVASVYSRDDR